MIAVKNSWMMVFDNLSYLPNWLSDCLCRLSTGGGFSTRELWTNDEEILFDATRPVILGSIEDLAQRGDLLERGIVLRLPSIPEEKRRPEKELLAEFSKARPYILGALLNAVAAGLKNLPSVRLARLPRMADFALWVSACEPGLGWKQGSFMEAHSKNLEEGNELALDSSVITKPLREFVEARGSWEDTATVLLDELVKLVSDKTAKSKEWPKGPRGLSGKLRRLAPSLRRVGFMVEFDRETQATRSRLIRLGYRLGDFASEPSEPSSVDVRADGLDGLDAKSAGYKDLGPPPLGQQFFEE
jgi:hypothetical protein